MKTIRRKTPFSLPLSETEAVNFLVEKMGITKKEFKELYSKSGVSATQMIEVMRYSKYQFIHQDETPRCLPCKAIDAKIVVSRFA